MLVLDYRSCFIPTENHSQLHLDLLASFTYLISWKMNMLLHLDSTGGTSPTETSSSVSLNCCKAFWECLKEREIWVSLNSTVLKLFGIVCLCTVHCARLLQSETELTPPLTGSFGCGTMVHFLVHMTAFTWSICHANCALFRTTPPVWKFLCHHHSWRDSRPSSDSDHTMIWRY